MLGRIRLFFIFLAAAGLLSGGVSCSSRSDGGDDSLFRMMIRLWPAHHDDPALADDLVEAFRKYDFCDEVWFCGEFPATRVLSFHDSSAARMGVLADRLREMDIIPSLQVVVLGHGDGAVIFAPDGSVLDRDSTIHWGTMIGPNGEKTRTVNCPRQPAYLEYMEKAFVPYVRACRPYTLYLDDDLRMTQHPPAMEGCFCDTCITLFNREHGYSFDRPGLVAALSRNEGGGTLRRQWVKFGQESLAGLARVISRSVHRVSPETRVGLQHNYFHHNMLEGWDWIPMLQAMQEETGYVPPVRPGELFYNDHEPRGILKKGLEISREIRRLPEGVVEIAPEIEGYRHKALGKSDLGICLETMYYLAMGATQMSYAIICGNMEPMSWYADNYFKYLADWKGYAKEYADFNLGSMPSGIDPYMSPNLCTRNLLPGEHPWAWVHTDAGSEAFSLAALGLPFAPEDPDSPVLLLDAVCARGMEDGEVSSLLASHGIVADRTVWQELERRGLVTAYSSVPWPENGPEIPADMESRYRAAQSEIRLLETASGSRLAVVPSYSIDINGAEQMALAGAFDWASGQALRVLPECPAQVSLVPRTTEDGRLRSVALLSCTISDEEHLRLRLRPGAAEDGRIPERYVLKRHGRRDIRLRPRFDGGDVLLEIPVLEGWEFAWIAIGK